MKRTVSPEILDGLEPDDPRAVGSRRDLRRLNRLMGSTTHVLRALRSANGGSDTGPILDLGAGDGDFALRIASGLPRVRSSRMSLLDRRARPTPEIAQGLAALGWQLECLEEEVVSWLAKAGNRSWSAIFANLFLHHFEDSVIARMLEQISERTPVFIAFEPRRSALALCFSKLVRLIGCNPVTAHDAPVSVRGGFRDKELSALWPAGNRGWKLREVRAGPFGHLFFAHHSSSSR